MCLLGRPPTPSLSPRRGDFFVHRHVRGVKRPTSALPGRSLTVPGFRVAGRTLFSFRFEPPPVSFSGSGLRGLPEKGAGKETSTFLIISFVIMRTFPFPHSSPRSSSSQSTPSRSGCVFRSPSPSPNPQSNVLPDGPRPFFYHFFS